MNTKILSRLFCKFIFFITFSIFFSVSLSFSENNSSLSVDEGDECYYYLGLNEPPAKWNTIGFKKEGKEWRKAQTGIGYGDQRARTYLREMKGNYDSIYSINDLHLSKADYELLQKNSTKLTITITCDGAFKVWLNGAEVIRSHRQRIASVQEMQHGIDIESTSLAREVMHIGQNILSAQCSNDRLDSENFLFIPALKITGE